MFNAAITLYVNANFPNGDGYTALMRTYLISFLETDIAPLVSQNYPTKDVFWQVEGVIDNSIYRTLDSVQMYKLNIACEWTINLVMSTYMGDSAAVFAFKLVQSGTLAPVLTILQNTLTIGFLDPITTDYDNVGAYNVNLPAGSFPDPSAGFLFWSNGKSFGDPSKPSIEAGCTLGPDVIIVNSIAFSTDLGTGGIDGTFNNNILNPLFVELRLY